MSAERVALFPECVECGDVWQPADAERWRAYLDTDDELVFYCPECADTGTPESGCDHSACSDPEEITAANVQAWARGEQHR